MSDILLAMELRALKEFLKHVADARNPEDDDTEAILDEGAFDRIYSRQQIAARAVYYEINALVERELREAASEAWYESRHRGPKTIYECVEQGRELRALKRVEDLPFPEVIKLVEGRFAVQLSGLPGWKEFQDIRDAVNAFKHRQGFVDWRKRPLGQVRITDRHRVNLDTAELAIETARKFIFSLRDLVPLPPSSSPLIYAVSSAWVSYNTGRPGGRRCRWESERPDNLRCGSRTARSREHLAIGSMTS